MADDSAQNATDVIATDHVSTLNGAAITIGPTTPKVQRVKVAYGDDNTSRDVSAAFPLPITGTGTAGTAATGVQTVQGIAGGTAQNMSIADMKAATLAVTVTAAAGAVATLTLPAPAAGLFHYITHIKITLYSSAARTGAAAPWVVTTTNLPGSPAFTFSTAGAIGTTETQDLVPSTPIRSSVAATATTVAAPIATGGIWRITAYYFTA